MTTTAELTLDALAWNQSRKRARAAEFVRSVARATVDPFAGVTAHNPVDQTPVAWSPAPTCENVG